VGSFFGITIERKRPKRRTPEKPLLENPVKVDVRSVQETDKNGPPITITTKAEKKARKRPSKTARPTVEVKSAGKEALGKRSAAESPPHAKAEAADLHALAQEMGVAAETQPAPPFTERPKAVQPPAETDFVIERPKPERRRATRKTKHDKVVEALAKSFERRHKGETRKKRRMILKRFRKKPRR
jgi:hypothetical protein